MFGRFGLGLMKTPDEVLVPPVISGVTVVPSTITKSESVKISWSITNMTSSDLSFIEFVGTGVIIQGLSSDYSAYTVTIPGSDLPLMTDNIVKIVAVNSDGWDTDTSKTLTVNPKVLPDYEVYQGEVVKRLIQLMMDYTDNQGIKIFEQFKGHIYLNPILSAPTYPAMSINVSSGNREPLAIKRQDWWNLNLTVFFVTKDPSENSMNDHYKWIEGLDRVCRVNPRWDLDGEPDLAIHKGDLETWNFTFDHGDSFIISETEATVTVRTKVCLANQIS